MSAMTLPSFYLKQNGNLNWFYNWPNTQFQSAKYVKEEEIKKKVAGKNPFYNIYKKYLDYVPRSN